MAARLDSLGRRIGRNWWREYNCAVLQHAEDAWQALRESGLLHRDGSSYHQMSDEEFSELVPRPTLKQMLISNAGMAPML